MPCAVFGCGNNSHKNRDLKFHGFPRDEKICRQWVVACRRHDQINTKSARVCSAHFQPSDFQQSMRHRLMGYCPKNWRNLKPDAVPSLRMPASKSSNSSGGSESKRALRVEKRARKKITQELLAKSSSQTVQNDDQSAQAVTDGHKSEDEISTNNKTTRSGRIKRRQSSNNPTTPSVDEVELAAEPLKTSSCEEACVVSDQSALDYERQISELRAEISVLSRRVESVRGEEEEALRRRLKSVFTEAQISCLLGEERRTVHWSDEDIMSAITLRSFGPNAYWYLKKKLGYPLPAVNTLRRWLKTKLEQRPHSLLMTSPNYVTLLRQSSAEHFN